MPRAEFSAHAHGYIRIRGSTCRLTAAQSSLLHGDFASQVRFPVPVK